MHVPRELPDRGKRLDLSTSLLTDSFPLPIFLPALDASRRGAMRRHHAQEHRLRQEYSGRILLSSTQADRFREDASQGEAVVQALPIRGSPDTGGL